MNALIVVLGTALAAAFYALCWFIGNRNLGAGHRGGAFGDDWIEVYVFFPFWGALATVFVLLGVGGLLAGGISLVSLLFGVKS